MKAFKIVYILFFALLLFVPLSLTNMEEEVASHLDKRMLTDRPASLAEWLNKGEGFLRDRIGFRTKLILLYNTVLKNVFQHSEHGLILLGQEGQIFYGHSSYINNYQALDYNPEQPALLAAKLQSLQDTLQQKGIDFLYVNIPDKKTVYSEYFPKNIAPPLSPTLNIRLEQELDTTNVRHIFLKDMLIQARTKHDTFNKAVDIAHFNAYGAYYTHEAIARELQKIYPNYPLLQETDFIAEEEAFDLRHTISIMGTERVPVLKLKNRNFTIEEKPFASCYISSYNPDAPIKKTLLILGDSYMYDTEGYWPTSTAIDYYAKAFETVYISSNSLHEPIEITLARFQHPDMLIYETSERVIPLGEVLYW